MIRWMLRKGIDRFERTWDFDASYLRDIVEASPRAASRGRPDRRTGCIVGHLLS